MFCVFLVIYKYFLYRFVLDEHVNATTGLTAYVFNNTILPYNVTVVDTPGVENRMGNKTVSRLIKQWFEKVATVTGMDWLEFTFQELLETGAFRLDAISIVLKHDENQLGWPFIYELADVKRMFGDDLKTNVLPIITNSEVLPQPIAIKSLTQANISFLEYYKVNNVGFAPLPTGVSKLQHNLYWTHGIASLENLFRVITTRRKPIKMFISRICKRPSTHSSPSSDTTRDKRSTQRRHSPIKFYTKQHVFQLLPPLQHAFTHSFNLYLLFGISKYSYLSQISDKFTPFFFFYFQCLIFYMVSGILSNAQNNIRLGERISIIPESMLPLVLFFFHVSSFQNFFCLFSNFVTWCFFFHSHHIVF